MVSHPPQLWDHTDSISPSTFVPFCGFKTRLEIANDTAATILPNSSFPTCNSFTPVNLEGQLCYNIKLNMSGSQGKDGGLLLVLDMNEDRSISLGSSTTHKAENFKILRQNDMDQETAKVSPKIHIHLLTPSARFGGGSYKMTSVKNVKGTEAFLNMPENERQCVQERSEECQNRELLKHCNCVPWELQSVEVIFQNFHFLSQGGPVCSPIERECIEEATTMPGCGGSCEGIYADVNKMEEKIENNIFRRMITKYREYKRSVVKSIGFNSSSYKRAFGKLIKSTFQSQPNALRGRATRVEVGGCPDLL